LRALQWGLRRGSYCFGAGQNARRLYSLGRVGFATLSQSQRQSLLANWGASVRARIARRAPRGVGKGRASLRITVSGSGQILGVSLQRASGNTELGRLALADVRKAGRFVKTPRNWAYHNTVSRFP